MGSFLATCIAHGDSHHGANFTGQHGHHHHFHKHASDIAEEVKAGLPDSERASTYLDSSTRAVVQAFWINLLTLVGQLVAFSILMRSKYMARVLAPRWNKSRPPGMLLGWAWRAYLETHPTVSHGHTKRLLYLRLKNLDGAVMVRFCVLGFKFSATGSLFCLFLVPWYMAGPAEAPESTFNRYNMANLAVPGGGRSDRFWAVVVTAYLLTGLFFHFALEEWKNFVEMRRAHFARLAGVYAARGDEEPDCGAAQALRSVVVERVPQHARTLDGSEVGAHFEGLFPAAESSGARPSRVHSCVVQAETGVLYKRPEAIVANAGRCTLLRFRSALRERLPYEDQLTEAEACDLDSIQSVPLASRSDSEDSDANCGFGLGQQAWQTVQGFRESSREAMRLLNTLIVGSWNAGDKNMGSSTAFLTFYNVADRVAAEQLVLDSTLLQWQAMPAPESHDIIWPNASLPIAKVRVQSAFMSAMLLVLLLFWSIPVASLQLYISNLTPLLLHKLEDLGVFGSQLYSFLASYLPVLALIGLQYLLPAAFDFFARNLEGLKSSSQIQRRVLQTYFQYQLATLYVTVLSGSLLSGFCEILQKPTNVFYILQSKVPMVATYFINFVMARVGLSTPMLLLFSMLNLPGCGGGEHQGQDALPPVRPNYAMEASNLGMVLVLGMTYSCVAPLIMPACMVYFLLSGLVYRWLFLYVYTPEFSCDGGIWYELFNGSMVGLLLGTLSLAAAAAVYCGFDSLEFWAALLLIVLVVAIHRLFQVHYGLPSQFISLADAREMDAACEGVISEWLKDDYYIDPVIKSKPEECPRVAWRLAAAMGTAGCCCCGRAHHKEGDEWEDSSDSASDSLDSCMHPEEALEDIKRESRSWTEGLQPRRDGRPSAEALWSRWDSWPSTEGAMSKRDSRQSTEGPSSRREGRLSTEGPSSRREGRPSTTDWLQQACWESRPSTDGPPSREGSRPSTDGPPPRADSRPSTDGPPSRAGSFTSTEGPAPRAGSWPSTEGLLSRELESTPSDSRSSV